MQISPAERLQKAALRIASREGTGLDLSATPGRAGTMVALSEEAVRPGDRVVVIGAEGEAARLALRKTAQDGAVTVIDSEQSALEGAVEGAPAQSRLVQAALEDLRTDPALLARLLAEDPVSDLSGYRRLENALGAQRMDKPLLADESADVIILDWAVNRLPAASARQMVHEAFRVLRRGGRLLLTVLLADEQPPVALPPMPGSNRPMRFVPTEMEVMTLLGEAGYYGMTYAGRAELPLKVVSGVELRAFVVEAYKGKQGPCVDRGHAVIYQGPWKEVLDDDGHRYVRGERVAVCEKTYAILQREPYRGQLFGLPCYLDVPADQAPLFDCNTPQVRDPKVTKGVTTVFEARQSCCDTSSGNCC